MGQTKVTLPTSELSEIGFRGREVKKFLEFCCQTAQVLREAVGDIELLVDLCAGNGLGSFVFQFNGLARESLMIDSTQPPRFRRLRRLFRQYELAHEYCLADLKSEEFSLDVGSRQAAIIAVHPCSELADRVIKIGLQYKLPFALMTCCHKRDRVRYELKDPPDTRLLLYDEPADYFDLVRQRYIEEQGWQCHRLEIPKRISAKNHILIGVPKV